MGRGVRRTKLSKRRTMKRRTMKRRIMKRRTMKRKSIRSNYKMYGGAAHYDYYSTCLKLIDWKPGESATDLRKFVDNDNLKNYSVDEDGQISDSDATEYNGRWVHDKQFEVGGKVRLNITSTLKYRIKQYDDLETEVSNNKDYTVIDKGDKPVFDYKQYTGNEGNKLYLMEFINSESKWYKTTKVKDENGNTYLFLSELLV